MGVGSGDGVAVGGGVVGMSQHPFVQQESGQAACASGKESHAKGKDANTSQPQLLPAF